MVDVDTVEAVNITLTMKVSTNSKIKIKPDDKVYNKETIDTVDIMARQTTIQGNVYMERIDVNEWSHISHSQTLVRNNSNNQVSITVSTCKNKCHHNSSIHNKHQSI